VPRTSREELDYVAAFHVRTHEEVKDVSTLADYVEAYRPRNPLLITDDREGFPLDMEVDDLSDFDGTPGFELENEVYEFG